MCISNFNGLLQNNVTSFDNRAFLYADALFDTLVYKNNSLVFFEAHYFRLLASMRQLRMDIPNFFTQEYWQQEIIKTIEANTLTNARVRTTVFRDALGLYTPSKHEISILIQVSGLKKAVKETYSLGLYKDQLLNTNTLDNLKTTNRMHNVLAAIYAKENGFDNCMLINHKKQVAETINANIFFVVGHEVRTPPLSSGCINGVVRQEIIDFLKKSKDYQIKEVEITSFELQNADEVFLTNSVVGIQPVTQYKRKTYVTHISDFLVQNICKKQKKHITQKN